MKKMGKLEEYIKHVREKTQGFSDLEIIRYVYMDLGKRLAFNLEYGFGNSKKRTQLYRESGREDAIDKALETNVIICKTVAAMLEKILREFDIMAPMEVASWEDNKMPHVYNIAYIERGEFVLDLQADLPYIQSHSFTRQFGMSPYDREEYVITRREIEEMDEKLGFVSQKQYYADEYVEFLKLSMSGVTDFNTKVKVILENIEPYTSKNMKYAELKRYHENIIHQLFSIEERAKIHLIDCWITDEYGNKKYTICIAVNNKQQSSDIFMYSLQKGRYEQLSMEQFIAKENEGMKHNENIFGLKKFKRNIETKQECR